MTLDNTNKPLTDDEIDQLSDCLTSAAPHSMNIEMLDGFLSALICNHSIIKPYDCLDIIFGEDFSFSSKEQASFILTLICRHWNTIASNYIKSEKTKANFSPLFVENDAGVIDGHDWANGFMTVVDLRPEDWRELFEDEEFSGLMVPMMILATNHHQDLTFDPNSHNLGKGQEIIMEMIRRSVFVYRYFEGPSQADDLAPSKKSGHKIGRNDQCPCGSGRKYKQCCSLTQKTIH
jgi:uncharacterized protein